MSQAKKLYRRPQGTIMNLIDVGNNRRTGAVMKMLDEKFSPPKDWNLKAKPYKPKQKTVKVRVPVAWAEMAAFVARTQRTTASKYMSTLLGEALREVMYRIRRQWDEGLGKKYVSKERLRKQEERERKRQNKKAEALASALRQLGVEDL